MKVIVPFKPINPKSRLGNVLNSDEREEFAKLMLLDVLKVLRESGLEVKVITTSKIDVGVDAEIVEDNRELDECINAELIEVPKAVVMSDLPLLNLETIERFFEMKEDVIIAPGRKGGTNMLAVRRKGFKVSYHYCSFLKHVSTARSLGYSYRIFDSFYASIDIDTEDDILELMIHGEGKLSRSFLNRIGFHIEMAKVPKLVRYVKYSRF
ncbi:MAG: 2-phospho-L-lactate guanylyltransferase [Archaeoglobaceae archaeon]|nr:2-phospho-L-lactate guanylyltransferase [Archaeoglobaceae archaeon]MDW7989719.1 2-phospho-L-lactate guanylyltransferase [Archaeoglobaceae archaeon]